MDIIFKLVSFCFFIGSVALGAENIAGNESKKALYSVGLFASPGTTTNSAMPTIQGFQISKKSEFYDFYLELAFGKYKNDTMFTNTVVSREKTDQKSKGIYAAGLRGLFLDYAVWDLAIGINQFSYSNSGTDNTCCVPKDYERSYDFSGAFIRPSIGLEYNFSSWVFGLRIFSWMEYFSKSVSNKVDDKALNPYITTTLDAADKDNIQSSHLFPPHIYINYTF